MSDSSTPYFSSLDHEGLLQVAGPDTERFLQGQVTCDLRQLDESRGLPGAYCTPQGRVVCDFLAGRTGDEQVSLRMRRDLLPTAAETFGKYIVFSKAELAPDPAGWRLYGCWGDGAARLLQEHAGARPEGAYAALSTPAGLLIQLDTSGRRFELWLRGEEGEALAQALAQAATAATGDDWIALDIAAGLGRVEAATAGEFVPQMLNYDRTGHISFSKGCYTGQEVVARLHYRGTPKRRLYPLAAAGLEPAAPGTPVFAGGEQSIGNIVNAVTVATGETRASAVLTVAQAGAELHLGAPGGPLLAATEPPYSLQDEAD